MKPAPDVVPLVILFSLNYLIKCLNVMKRKQSKHNQIRTHLESGRTITGLGALSSYGLYNLKTVIFRLRNEGMKIQTLMVKDKKDNSYGLYYQVD